MDATGSCGFFEVLTSVKQITSTQLLKLSSCDNKVIGDDDDNEAASLAVSFDSERTSIPLLSFILSPSLILKDDLPSED